jgi:iron complex transport system ATP-binding protein
MLLKVDGMAFSYRANPVLQGVTFEVRPAELVVILGPNGAGKSTLLKCLNGILRPSGGAVLLDGKPLRAFGPERLARLVGYVPQATQANFMTVFDAVLLGRKPHFGWGPSAGDLEFVERVLRLLGLESLALRRLHELSGGELQRVTLARALAQQPRLLLLDEPTSNLDIRSQLDIMAALRDIAHQGDVSCLVATHDINLGLRYGDRFLVMKDGLIWAQGDAHVIQPELIEEVYGVGALVAEVHGLRLVIPCRAAEGKGKLPLVPVRLGERG